MKLTVCCALLSSLVLLMGCRTDVVEVSGPEFIAAFEKRKANEECWFREDASGFYYLDCYRMGKTESAFKKVGSLRTATKNLTADQILMLKQKAVPGEWAKPFLKK